MCKLSNVGVFDDSIWGVNFGADYDGIFIAICVQIKKSLGLVFKTIPFLLESSLTLLEKFWYLWSSSKLQGIMF